MAPEPRVNDRIRSTQVRLIGDDGTQYGVVEIQAALSRARDADLDLVEVAPAADPPVCKIMDYGKWRYEKEVKAKETRRKQAQTHQVKGMRFRPKISGHDYETKKRQVARFLEEGSKVKAMVLFRGREKAHTDLGARVLENLAEDLSELASVVAAPKMDGSNMTMVLAPVRKTPAKLGRAGQEGDSDAKDENPQGGGEEVSKDRDG